MKKWSFSNKFVLIAGLVLASQGFALDCATGTGWGDFLTVEATDSDGDGYYEIDTPEKLAWLSCMTVHKSNPYGAAKVKLTADLDLEGKLFIPISAGTGSPKFTGEIDGQGHSIVNLYIKGSEIANNATSEVTGESKNGAKAYAQNIGLVAVLSGNGKISNLTIGISDIYASTSAGETGVSQNNPISVGTLVGWMEGGTVENCVVEGHITTSGDNNRVGGLVGNVKNATITNCLSLVSITASGQGTHVGGVVGALRNGGTVNLSSCIFAGDTLISTGGSLGGIVGNYESSTVKTQEGLYYSGDYSGVGNGKTVTTTKKDDVNTEEVVCVLNGGTWNSETGLCSGETSDMWSVGLSGLSMNGSDGYKVAFDANGGTFAAGSKTSKVVAKGAAITADEISVPTRTDNTFVGWAVARDATDPSASLGTANKSTTIYAVWEPMFKVTFSAAPGVFPEGSADTKEVSVSRGDIVSIEGFNVPETYKDASDGNKTYYFTGWAWESKKFPEDHEISSADTIHLADIILDKDTTIYAVWTAAKTVTVTYKANEHGKSRVEFMKVEAGSSVAQPEDPIADAGYSFVDWCMETPCEHVFDFETQISDNIILYAHWQAERFVINYELDGGTNNAANPSSYTIDTTDIVFAAPTKEGHFFDGWFYNYSNNEGVETFENLATQITSGSTGVKTLYAKWTPEKYIVRYNSGNTVSGTVTSDVKTYGEPMLLKGVQEVYAHAGCVQDGWSRAPYVDKNYNLDFAFDSDGKVWYEENANLIVYPHWTCNTYSINYNLGFGEGIVTNHKDNPGSYTGPAVLTLKNAYDPKNKMFMDNWFLEPTFKTAIRDVQNIDADLTVYARWYNKITYKPGSNVSGAKNLEEKKYFDNTYTFKSSIDKYVRANYTLDGWSTTDGGEKVYELGEKYTTNENLTLYPHWVENRDSIQYGAVKIYTYASDGHKEAVIDGNSEEETNIPEDIEVDAVTFDRTFPVGNRSTIVLPFDIAVANTHGGKFNVLSSISGDFKTITLGEKTSQLYAYEPYVMLADELTLTFDGPVTLKKTVDGEKQIGTSDWYFVPAYEKIVFGERNDLIGRAYGFAGKAVDKITVGQFVKVGGSAYVNPMRAYLVYRGELNGSSATKSAVGSGFGTVLPDEINVVVQDEQGNIVERGVLDTKTGEFHMDSWYDLQGRKLNGQPKVQGTYYRNGKRVIVK
ncbi:MAG: InlB B-repeat-containing protein [Fibrobacter sp.]|nr:InlB B-repeat-containing protein [Fibrobacter sp.]